jgi:L-threonylcarbamoyladenylate synthase
MLTQFYLFRQSLRKIRSDPMHAQVNSTQTRIVLQDKPATHQYAAKLVAEEQIIAAPTDTVYGVMGRYDSQLAIERLHAAKERPRHKAIPILIANIRQLERIVQPPLPPQTETLVEHFWPGPLTLIVPAHPALLPILTAGQTTVAVRMPDHPWLLALIEQTGPLAATSANRSGEADARTAQQAAAVLGGKVPLIVDGGTVAGGTASTIVDLTGSQPAIVRAGPIHEAVRQRLQVSS